MDQAIVSDAVVPVVNRLTERFEHVERETIDVRDESVREPGEGLLGVVEVAMGERRGAAKEVRA